MWVWSASTWVTGAGLEQTVEMFSNAETFSVLETNLTDFSHLLHSMSCDQRVCLRCTVCVCGHC